MSVQNIASTIVWHFSTKDAFTTFVILEWETQLLFFYFKKKKKKSIFPDRIDISVQKMHLQCRNFRIRNLTTCTMLLFSRPKHTKAINISRSKEQTLKMWEQKIQLYCELIISFKKNLDISGLKISRKYLDTSEQYVISRYTFIVQDKIPNTLSFSNIRLSCSYLRKIYHIQLQFSSFWTKYLILDLSGHQTKLHFCHFRTKDLTLYAKPTRDNISYPTTFSSFRT